MTHLGDLDLPSQPVLRKRRLLVAGSSALSSNTTAELCRTLGREIARDAGLILITGGAKGKQGLTRPAADQSFVDGALETLRSIRADPKQHIETVIPDPDFYSPADRREIVRFEIGRTIMLRKRSPQARRFNLVYRSDAILTIEGDIGTRHMIDLGLAIERPVLPLPFAGGISSKRWHENRETIQDWFGIPDAQADQLEAIDLSQLAEDDILPLVRQILGYLQQNIRRKCFVAMAFDDEMDALFRSVIDRAVKHAGFIPVRTDQTIATGDAVRVVLDAIASCDVAVVDITHLNPNVIYELGHSHAHGKPTIVLCRRDTQGNLPTLPFDLRNEHVIPYVTDDSTLFDKLTSSLTYVTEQRKHESEKGT